MKKFLLTLCVLFSTVLGVSAQCSTFYDGFESGSFGAGWTMQGGYTTTFPATGSAVGTYHLVLTGTSSHYGGPYATFPAMQVGYVSYRIRTTTLSAANNYFVLGDANTTSNNGILFNYVNSTGNLRFYSGASYDYNYPISANVWYHVEIMNINWTAKTYDIYINGTLVVTGQPFRSTATTAVDRFYIYNFNSATSNYDEIIIGGSPVTASSVSTGVSCFGGSDGSASVTATGGNGIYTYNWTPSGGTAATATNLTAGSYTCTITDGNGCSATSVVSITQPAAITAITTQTDVTCYGGATGVAVVNASGGTGSYTYAWSPTGGTNDTATSLTANGYTCTITDANGCTSTASFSVTEPPQVGASISQTDILCNGMCNGTATATATGGTGTYTYVWNPPGATSSSVMGLCAGNYTLTVTSGPAGCTATDTMTITQPSALTSTTSQTNVACAGGNNGEAVVSVTGGVGSYQYAWSPTGGNSDTASGLSAGTYTCQVTDANGCTMSTSVSISQPSPLIASDSVIPPLCNGGIGTVIITCSGGTPPYSGDSTYSVFAGTNMFVITDANGCGGPIFVAVQDPPPLVAFVSQSNGPTTCGGNDGSIDISPAGGTPGYTFQWSNSATTEDLTGLSAGTYSCAITDNNGCTANVNPVTLSDPPLPNVTYSEPVDTVCDADAAFALSGANPSTGTWTGPGVTAGSFDPASANAGNNVITYTYTDSLGCSGSASDAIFVDPCLGISPNGSLIIPFSVYPNPTSGQVTITSESGATITLFNALGEVVITLVSTSSTTEINLRGFAEGIYLVVVEQNDLHSTKQIILSR